MDPQAFFLNTTKTLQKNLKGLNMLHDMRKEKIVKSVEKKRNL